MLLKVMTGISRSVSMVVREKRYKGRESMRKRRGALSRC
jgi:hypothetical protein